MLLSGAQDKGNDQDEDEDGDALDVFDTGLSNLFSIPPIAFSSSSSGLLTYTPPPDSKDGRRVRLRIPNPSSEVFTKLQANHLWLSALYLADLIGTEAIDLGPRVIELGAGAGLPGIAACRLGAEVLSTDWGDESILACLKENFERNCSGGRWGVLGHEWGTDTRLLLGFDPNRRLSGKEFPLNGSLLNDSRSKKFDTILLADTLWISSAHDVLLDSVQALLHPKGTVHVAAGLHTGRWPVESFIDKAKHRGLNVQRIREARWAGQGKWESLVERPNGSGTGEERGVVVYLRLHRSSDNVNA